ncbi:hypothetical protein SAMN05421858_4456 [Haladaptatus litoreus]|uniref:DUF5518 domain-containing protein n=1 Tax=Haladaptatus litoreus TaxID=553468 RepID=A0A1N7EP10_9EURY|nr:DUF5518 domain-containing protein [Haladaptatus litoreus]SIR89831.1 hypothetical protein SAMN05421858_4456 [Haladaptatus litoreus]
MVRFNQTNKTSSEWKYALIGGLISIPLTVGYNWFFEPEIYSLIMATIGGMIASYLAKRNALRIYRTGIGAGALGAIPALVMAFSPLSDIATKWLGSGAIVFTVIVVPLVIMAILAIGAVLGFIGAAIGGWLATKFGNRNTVHPAT